jgi:hemerythrin-like domain-containing protein
MKITDVLYGEHGMFYPVFDYFNTAMQANLELGELKSMAKVFKEMITTHANMEEAILFTALETHIGQVGPLSVMRAEHGQIDDALEAILAVETIDDFKHHFGGLIDLLRNHFSKEEKVLFVIAQKVLDEPTQLELAERWSVYRGVSIPGLDTTT